MPRRQDRPMTDKPGGATERSEAKDNPCDATALRKVLGGPGESVEHEGPGRAHRAPLELFRVYVHGEDVFDGKGYPLAWQEIKHLVRAEAGDRCLRCGHPYTKGDGEWSACDERCAHGGPMRVMTTEGWADFDPTPEACGAAVHTLGAGNTEARWRVLTVHHLDGDKANCRWWNLVSLCQRDHLQIQRVVKMEAPWPWPHTDWFKPYAAAFYAFKYLGEDLERAAVDARLDELLGLGVREAAVERMAL